MIQDNNAAGLLGGRMFSPLPLIRAYRVETYVLDPQLDFPTGMAALAVESSLRVVFGPVLDAKVQYVSDQLINHTPILPGGWLAHVPARVLHHDGPRLTAILDERGRPWAFFGSEADPDSVPDATATLAHPDFYRAVSYARSTALFMAGVEPIYPADVLAILNKGPQKAVDAERRRVTEFIDSHWADPPAPS